MNRAAGTRVLLVRSQLLDPVEIPRLRGFSGPRSQIIPLERSGYCRRPAEEPARFGSLKTREPGRFKKGRAAIGGFDDGVKFRGVRWRKAETAMDRAEQPPLDRLVIVPDHRLERRDHVADDVFGGVVEQHGKAAAAVKPRRPYARQGFDQQAMLGD